LYTQPIYGEAKVVKEEVVKLKENEEKLNAALKKKDNLATTSSSSLMLTVQPSNTERF
jgi:hypothetical protein